MTAASLWPAEWGLVAASSVGIFWLVCLVVVLIHVGLGWRSGVGRQMAVVVGLLAGWLVGLSQGPAFFAHFWAGTKHPSVILIWVASAILGLLVYAIAVLAGRLLFKRACDHPFGPTRIFLGSGGALVGLFLGLFVVWMLIAVVRLGGAVAQVEVASPAAPQPEPRPNAGRANSAADHLAESTAPALVRMKRSVESGWIGWLVRFTDPFPTDTYADVTKVARIVADPVLQQRLLNAPSLHDIATDPKVVALRQDPSALDAFESRDYASLASNPRLRAVLDDPHLSRRLEQVNITRLLNETVQ
jgi:hypothetical protein